MKQPSLAGIKHSFVAASILLITGCAATATAIEHRNLESNTRLSKTVFLDPVAPSQKSIFITVKNTSEQSIEITKGLSDNLQKRGYRVVNNPSQAHYLLQANVLRVGKMSRASSQEALGGGYGSALAGAGTGAALGALSGHGNAVLAGGILGGVAGLAVDSLVKDVHFTMVTDVQISERVAKGVKIHEQFDSDLSNGSSSGIHQSASREGQYQRYRTRIISSADKVNLAFKDAKPALEQGLVKALAGIF